MQKRRGGMRPLFVTVLLLGWFLAPEAGADILKKGFTYCNFNFSPVTLTFSWSGSYPGEGEVCLLPQTVTIPAGGCVHLNPPAGFTPTDLIILSSVLNGQDSGGGTIYDPPSTTTVSRIGIPCAAEGTKVWFFQYFGERDYGPVFTNVPTAMKGFDVDGLPEVYAAELEANGAPKINQAEGHCFIATDTKVIADVATRKVYSEYEPKTTGEICAEIIFGENSANVSSAAVATEK